MTQRTWAGLLAVPLLLALWVIALTNPLPWDQVPTAKFQVVNRVRQHLPTLRERSAKRVGSGKDFVFLREEIALVKKSLASKSIVVCVDIFSVSIN